MVQQLTVDVPLIQRVFFLFLSLVQGGNSQPSRILMGIYDIIVQNLKNLKLPIVLASAKYRVMLTFVQDNFTIASGGLLLD